MLAVPPCVRFFLAVGTAAALVGCGSSDDAATPTGAASTASTSSAATDDARQGYVDAVNQLCDDLLPKIIDATEGGSIDIPAAQYLRDWPAHKALVDGFDEAWGNLPVPPSASDAALAMSGYVTYAGNLDLRRHVAAEAGEKQWRAEVRKEDAAPLDPRVTARTAAGFHQSCDAR